MKNSILIYGSIVAGNDGDGSINRKIYTWAIGMSATDGEPTLNNPKTKLWPMAN